ncbi:hypothetical protein MRB53_019322 [Persea americana]|uniref:Uncharacterized protein n=1 Tax=Persea americana TaxID=3435 RepID=A0ACC2KYB2_PERAE|nr:hypothetical protein MRB53_019322 [Persea americana]
MSTGPESLTADRENQQSLPLILTIILLIFFFLGFFSIYFCRYIANVTWIHRHPLNSNQAPLHTGNSPHNTGLHPSIIASFPTFTYALVKDHRRSKCSLECAVCLSEFSDNDILRLLTVCSHAFHPDCIDLWFESHTTCPVCRRDLDPAAKSPEKTPEVRIHMPESQPREEALEREEEVVAVAPPRVESWHRISFKEEEERRGEGGDSGATAESKGERCRVAATAAVDWLPRSHSTGHSIIEDDRFTLRLPENVKERIVRDRNWTGSCIAFGDLSNAVVDDRKDDDMGAGEEGRLRFSKTSPQLPS